MKAEDHREGRALASSEPGTDKRAYSRSGFDPEMEDTEFSANPGTIRSTQAVSASTGSGVIGWTAILLAVLSIFAYPGFFGSAAILAGLYAFFRGSRMLGGLAATVGIITLIAYWIFAPLTM